MGCDNGKAIYIGVTNNLTRRVREHKEGLIDGFTKRYHCHKLLYFEEYTEIKYAIAREKQLKRWGRDKKELLIASMNPDRDDLADGNWGGFRFLDCAAKRRSARNDTVGCRDAERQNYAQAVEKHARWRALKTTDIIVYIK